MLLPSKINYMLFIFLSLTGCVYGDLNKTSIEHFSDDAGLYCKSGDHRECNKYSECYKGIYFSYPTKFLRNNLLMYMVLPKKNDKYDYTNLMSNISNEINKLEMEKKPDLSIEYSYMLYAHNQCALIMGDKLYDISKYEPYIKSEIKKKATE